MYGNSHTKRIIAEKHNITTESHYQRAFASQKKFERPLSVYRDCRLRTRDRIATIDSGECRPQGRRDVETRFVFVSDSIACFDTILTGNKKQIY